VQSQTAVNDSAALLFGYIRHMRRCADARRLELLDGLHLDQGLPHHSPEHLG